jgi:hypothetical protein
MGTQHKIPAAVQASCPHSVIVPFQVKYPVVHQANRRRPFRAWILSGKGSLLFRLDSLPQKTIGELALQNFVHHGTHTDRCTTWQYKREPIAICDWFVSLGRRRNVSRPGDMPTNKKVKIVNQTPKNGRYQNASGPREREVQTSGCGLCSYKANGHSSNIPCSPPSSTSTDRRPRNLNRISSASKRASAGRKPSKHSPSFSAACGRRFIKQQPERRQVKEPWTGEPDAIRKRALRHPPPAVL